jgi:hypothetical protein
VLCLGFSYTDWIQAAAVAVGVVIAALGLVTWRKQLRGTRAEETALGLLEAALRARDAFQDARHAVTFGGPISGSDYGSALAAAQSVDESLRNATRGLDVARVRAEAVFGPSARRVADDVYAVGGRLRATVWRTLLARAKDAQPVAPATEDFAAWTSDDPDKDEGTRAILAAIEPVEAWARRVLE